MEEPKSAQAVALQERQRALIARLKQVPKHSISLKRCAYRVVRRVSKCVFCRLPVVDMLCCAPQCD
jgi:hypothetical protein